MGSGRRAGSQRAALLEKARKTSGGRVGGGRMSALMRLVARCWRGRVGRGARGRAARERPNAPGRSALRFWKKRAKLPAD